MTDTQILSVKNLKDINDELEREMVFYKLALNHVVKVHDKKRANDELFFPPDEYHGDKVKDSNHMDKIKRRLVAEQTRINKFEQRKKQQENKNSSKYTQLQVEQSRKHEKNSFIDKVSKIRKNQAKSVRTQRTRDQDQQQSFSKPGHDNKGSKMRKGDTDFTPSTKQNKFANDPLTKFISGTDSEWDYGPDSQGNKRFKPNAFQGKNKKYVNKPLKQKHRKTRHKRRR